MFEVLTVLRFGVDIDRSKFVGLGAGEMADTMFKANETNLPITFVTNANQFFTAKNLITLIKEGDNDWQLVAEKLDVEVAVTDVIVIKSAVAIVSKIVEQCKKIEPAYPFADVPSGWSVKSELIIVHNRSVRRPGANYTIGLNTLRGLWVRASKVWTGQKVESYLSVSASGYHKTAIIRADRIEIGCQSIQRFEIEQFASQQGWDFPTE